MKITSLFSTHKDLIFLIFPVLLPSIVFLVFFNDIPESHGLSPWGWFLIVVGLDVSHVYATIYRTYFSPELFARRKALFLTIPVGLYALSVFVYSISPSLFWSLAAYTAVYHFIRQQFGFMALYRRVDPNANSDIPFFIDKYAIYLFTGLPILAWHFANPQKQFNWFINNDFFLMPNELIYSSLKWFLFIAYFLYFTIVIMNYHYKKYIHLFKLLFISATALAWYTGIVHFNNDLVFSVTNVIAHGIPYIFIVWECINRTENIQYLFLPKSRNWFMIFLKMFIFLTIIFNFSLGEEFFWDVLVWKDHGMIFGNWDDLYNEVQPYLKLLVPLLFLPQVTHYILDAYIWRTGKENPELESVFFRGR